jgi:TM2 domain-containing membrane protein YozV
VELPVSADSLVETGVDGKKIWLRTFDKKKLTSLILSFPFPFGIVGLHRIHLGCPPYVPVVYIASLGGVFGLVPLIDFFVLLFEKNPDKYVNNKGVFMWIK